MSGKKHLIRNGIITATAMGLVQFLVPGGWGWVFAQLRLAVDATVAWVGSSVSVPASLLVILSAIALTAIGATAAVAYQRRRNRDAGTEFVTTADIFGIRWRWICHANGEISEIESFCPKCDLPVRPSTETRHGFINLISYKCDCRKWRSKSFHCSQEAFFDRVHRTILQETRKGPAKAAQRSA